MITRTIIRGKFPYDIIFECFLTYTAWKLANIPILISFYFISFPFLSIHLCSCGEGEDYHPVLDRIHNRHNRRLFRRLNNINHNHLDSQQIIPRQNARLRSLFDRVNQEIEKYRSKCGQHMLEDISISIEIK